jgi:TolB protein
LVLAALLACAVALLGASMKPAEAAFPGENGDVAFVRGTATEAGGYSDIYRVGPDGTRERMLTGEGTGYNVEPSWSPDGKRIVFKQADTDVDYGRIRMMDADGSGEVDLTDGSADDRDPAWFPSGDRIVFSRDRDGSGNDLYALDLDGTGAAEPVRLTAGPGQDTYPAVSPSGKKIAFASRYRDDTTSENADNSAIYVMRAAPEGRGNRPVRITSGKTDSFSPVWSPDGKRIAYTTYRSGFPGGGFRFYEDVLVMDADGTGKKNLTKDTPDLASDPAWSPDGKRIAFRRASFGKPGEEVWKMRPDGTRRTRIAGDGALPDWQPIP